MSRLKKLLGSFARIVAGVLVLGVGGLLVKQHSMIYFPRSYGAAFAERMPRNASALSYSTREGRQCAFYIPPSSQKKPERVWVMFGGNGALALDWTDFVMQCPEKRDGFLLVDYPGYGKCEGGASPASIAESSEAALNELAACLHSSREEVEKKLNVIGHSIGCAAGLAFASKHPVERVILAAPFTSLRDMARETVGWPLCLVLLQNFDNRARLAELAARGHPPKVTIVHGLDDSLIPIRMSRELAGMFPRMIRLHEIADADHNTITCVAANEMFAAMRENDAASGPTK